MRKERPVDVEMVILKEKNGDLVHCVDTDPMGSYTGRPTEKWELPVQDADDL